MTVVEPDSRPGGQQHRSPAAGYRSVRIGRLPTLSVVLTSRGTPRQLAAVLEQLQAQGVGRETSTELIVVRAMSPDESAFLEQAYPDVRFLSASADDAAPTLRSRGVAVADGDVVVLADDSRVPAPDWLARFGHGTERAPAVPLST